MSSNKKWTKSDLFIIGILFALLVGWGPLYNLVIAPRVEPPREAAPGGTNAVTSLAGTPAELRTAPASTAAAPVLAESPASAPAPTAATPAPAPAPDLAPAAPVVPDTALAAARKDPANLVVLSNSLVRLGISRVGGGIVFAELSHFPQSPDDKTPLVLDFAAEPALAIIPPNLPGRDPRAIEPFAADKPFEVSVSEDGRTARLAVRNGSGLTLERTLTLAPEDYRVTLEDKFVNSASNPAALPEYGLMAGSLFFPPAKGGMGSQGTYLGIDTLSAMGGAEVRHWGSSSFISRKEQLSDFFLPPARRGGGCAMSKPALDKPLPASIQQPVQDRADWIAVKNKFFTQILVPEGGSAGFILGAQRLVPPSEVPDLPSSWGAQPQINGVSAVLIQDPVAAGPGETVTRKLGYYVGPKEYHRIEPMGNKMVKIMEFGWFEWVCWLLLVTLKWLYKVIPNYGVVIILLTVLIRIIFWPITHKSTESMKKMQQVQPLIAALREKYRDKPQKLQEETMKLYKEHKVNPVGGCLPMLIQIPVFIALFNVLRSAVELRYAGFLWIPDLSEPEGLLAGVIPFIPSLNILPLIMTATSIWQSHLTPSGGDPSQQKMMMLMPIMMLFIFYSMPSALVLYWTANQVLMIVQLLWQKRAKQAAA